MIIIQKTSDFASGTSASSSATFFQDQTDSIIFKCASEKEFVFYRAILEPQNTTWRWTGLSVVLTFNKEWTPTFAIGYLPSEEP